MLAYRTTTGRLIDLWTFTVPHLAVASRLAAVAQQQVQAESRPSEEALRAEILHSFSFAGIGHDHPEDEALRTFVLDLAGRWLSIANGASQQEATSAPFWRVQLRARLSDALGLGAWGGKAAVARQLQVDPSAGSRFADALSAPQDAVAKARGDLLNQVEHLLDLRRLRLAVEEELPGRLLGELGTFKPWRGVLLPFREARFLLAMRRLLLAAKYSTSKVGWREYPPAHSDLAWSLGAWDDEFVVEGIANHILGVLAPGPQYDVVPVQLDAGICGHPDVCVAFHLGLFDAAPQHYLPILEDPAPLYEGHVRLDDLDTGEFIPRDGVSNAIGLASEGPPFPVPGQWTYRSLSPSEGREPTFLSILQTARRIRSRWPLATWIATGGRAAPSEAAGDDLEAVAAGLRVVSGGV